MGQICISIHRIEQGAIQKKFFFQASILTHFGIIAQKSSVEWEGLRKKDHVIIKLNSEASHLLCSSIKACVIC